MFFYNLFIWLYAGLVPLVALVNRKAGLFVKGRKDWRRRLEQQLQAKHIQSPVWFHCASLGEFEQGRPLIEAIKQQHPAQHILLTFFSPSGYEIRKNYELADLVMYLPLDTASNARAFLRLVKPKASIFVKYEFWLNFLFQLKKQNIPTFLVSAVFKTHQPFFKWYGHSFRKALKSYAHIFTQDNVSLELLKTLNVTHASVAGDTRFDRVLEIGRQAKDIPQVSAFSTQKRTIIAGSSWAKDEEMLLEAYGTLKTQHSDIALIIAPHEIDEANIQRIQKRIDAKGLSSKLITENPGTPGDVLIVNSMGYLSSIYRYGQIAVIGGGFDNGIHNILEPAVYGLPVLFGPNYHKFNEAHALLKEKGAFCFNSGEELRQQLSLLLNDTSYFETTSGIARHYVVSQAGATQRILERIRF